MTDSNLTPRKISIILALVLGLILTVFPDALGLIGLGISPGADDNFSDETFLATTYKGYEIWKDPAREGRGEFIIYTPPGVVPGISSIKYTKEAAKTTIDKKIKAYYDPPTSPDPDPVVYYEVTFVAGPGGTIDPSGSFNYKKDTQVWVMATPNVGYEFDEMTQDGELYSIQDNRVVGVTGSFTITAHFILDDTTEPDPEPEPSPSPSPSPEPPIDDPVDDIEDQVDQMNEGIPRVFARGTGVILTAIALVTGRKDGLFPF